MQRPVYLDYNATTPCDPRVVQAMLPYFTENFGNASSKSHPHGLIAEDAVEAAREQVAVLIRNGPEEIVFTSGATESLNLAIRGSLPYSGFARIITFAAEHSAVLDTVRHLAALGHFVEILPVDEHGLPDQHALTKALEKPAHMLALMLANNETGTINPVTEISGMCRERNIRMICDATQAVGKIPVDVQQLGADLVAFSGHKFYGPKGVGGLWIRSSVKILPVQFGGGHERKLRSGTLNVPGIVGLGTAAKIAKSELESDAIRMAALRDRLVEELLTIPDARRNGLVSKCLPQTASISFTGNGGDQLLRRLSPTVAASSGSACSSATTAPSHVLMAMGLSEKHAYSTIRFSLGKYTTESEIETTIASVRNLLR